MIKQKGISFEIVIADDGSKEDYFKEIRTFFQIHSFNDFVLYKNTPNVGTVKNLLKGIALSSGKYFFGYSPGDILKYQFVLRDLYCFSSRHNARCFFARAVYYHKDGLE